MQISPEELTKNGFTLLDKLEHSELVPFVVMYSKKRTKASFTYKALNIIFLLFLIFLVWRGYSEGFFTISAALLHLSYGVSLSFLLVPFHEYIHALAYKIRGAENTSFDAHWKRFYFMAIADQFVADRKDFKIVALAPFMVITFVFVISTLLASPLWAISFATIILSHAAFCSGDFALLSYFEFHNNKELVTYDDKENKISYFYSRDLKTTNKAL
uniref:DUF3267 domain-containing protein n=1 Tax=Roseivirga sp. TaxID=1964215 RepID=UPI0040475789